jgi:hypothetical protein
MKKLLTLALGVLFLLHNDWWWSGPRLLAGWPVQLVYHVAFCLVVTLVLWLLVSRLPNERDEDRGAIGGGPTPGGSR